MIRSPKGSFMMAISLDLSHNDPNRLFKEFLDPLAKFFPRRDDENTIVEVKVEDQLGCVGDRVAIVEVTQVRPWDYEDNWTTLAEWEFYEDGRAIPESGGDDDSVDWSTAAREIVRVCHEQMCKEIKRVDKQVKPAIVRLKVAFPFLRKMIKI